MGDELIYDSLVYSDILSYFATGVAISFGLCLVIGIIVWAVFYVVSFFKESTSV